MNSLFHKPNYFVNYFMKIKFMAIIKDKNRGTLHETLILLDYAALFSPYFNIYETFFLEKLL